MKVVADTDILSIFAKIRRFDILHELFEQVIIPQSVKSELDKGKINLSSTNIIVSKLTREELKSLKKVDERLDRGEKECFVISKFRNIPLATNEKVVYSICDKERIGYFSLPRLLRFAIMKKVISREEARKLVKSIEREENTIVKNKEEIFK